MLDSFICIKCDVELVDLKTQWVYNMYIGEFWK